MRSIVRVCPMNNFKLDVRQIDSDIESLSTKRSRRHYNVLGENLIYQMLIAEFLKARFYV